MIAITGETMVEDEDRQRAIFALRDYDHLVCDRDLVEQVAKALAGARAVEREACAKAAEATQPILMGSGGTGIETRVWEQPNPVAQACAHAIRCRTKWAPVEHKRPDNDEEHGT